VHVAGHHTTPTQCTRETHLAFKLKAGRGALADNEHDIPSGLAELFVGLAMERNLLPIEHALINVCFDRLLLA
jgi:hypothetical protein